MDFTDYLINTLPITLVELLAAIFATIFVRKQERPFWAYKFLMYYLWLTVMVDILGRYSPIAHYTDFDYFGFIEGTLIQENYWLYNIYIIIGFIFYPLFFRSFLMNHIWKKFIVTMTYLMVAIAFVILIFTDVFFKEISTYIMMLGTLVVFVSVGFFYFELLRKEAVIKLNRYLPFYISIGTLFFHLCITPVIIYSNYFKADNTEFVQFWAQALIYSNFLMYLTYTFGFIICRKKESH